VREKKFRSLGDVMELEEEVVFNCLKGENRVVFGDMSVKEVENCHVILPKASESVTSDIAIW
jgi:hypothetical protein